MQVYRLDAVEDEDGGDRECSYFLWYESAAQELGRRLDSQGWLTDFYRVWIPELDHRKQVVLSSERWPNVPIGEILDQLEKKATARQLNDILAARAGR